MEKQARTVKTCFVLSYDPETLRLVSEKQFAEARDYWKKKLEQLEAERQLAFRTFQPGLYEEVWEKCCFALRMYDRFYVLADLKAKGLDTDRGW